MNQRVLLHPVLLIQGCRLWQRFQPGDLAHASHIHAIRMTKASQVSIKDRDDPSADEELYAWTMRREAVASCLIEDIFHLKPNPAKSESSHLVPAMLCNISSTDYDFNWLGRVPCRSVKIAGMVIGIKDYESKRIYTSTFSFSSGLPLFKCIIPYS